MIRYIISLSTFFVLASCQVNNDILFEDYLLQPETSQGITTSKYLCKKDTVIEMMISNQRIRRISPNKVEYSILWQNYYGHPMHNSIEILNTDNNTLEIESASIYLQDSSGNFIEKSGNFNKKMIISIANSDNTLVISYPSFHKKDSIVLTTSYSVSIEPIDKKGFDNSNYLTITTKDQIVDFPKSATTS
jgi:hypothetical protein